MDLPLSTYELIEQLDALYPEVIYSADEPREEFLMRSGERRLVLLLKTLMANEAAEAREGAR